MQTGATTPNNVVFCFTYKGKQCLWCTAFTGSRVRFLLSFVSILFPFKLKTLALSWTLNNRLRANGATTPNNDGSCKPTMVCPFARGETFGRFQTLHLCPGLQAAAKIAIFRVLRKIATNLVWVRKVFALLAILALPIYTQSQRSQSLNKSLLSKGPSDIREIPLYFKSHHFMPPLN